MRGNDETAARHWEQQFSQRQRLVTVSAEAAAVIAGAIANSYQQPDEPPLTAKNNDGRWTVILSGHADAVIAGLVSPTGIAPTTTGDDCARVSHDGIHASGSTWAEINAAFPLSLSEQSDLSDVDLNAVWQEIWTAYPVSVFREWAEPSAPFAQIIDHFYDPEPGF